MSDEKTLARSEAADWQIRLSEDPDDHGLRADFEAWLKASALNPEAWTGLQKTVAAIHRAPAEKRGYDPAFLQKPTLRRTGRGRNGTARRTGKRYLFAAAAAACMALVAIPAVNLHLRADYITGAGDIRQIRLSDGTKIVLGPDSAIGVEYGASARTVRLLTGQAHFDVVRDPARPFRVRADQVETTVLGTAFDVRMVGERTSVSVGRGRVRVEAPGRSPEFLHELTAGQSVVLEDGAVLSATENPELVGAWQSGSVLLRHRTIAQAIEEVLPWYRGKILLLDRALGGRPVTGIYNLHDPAEALSLMTNPHGGRVIRVTPWFIIVTSG